jgi:hypothetical protein
MPEVNPDQTFQFPAIPLIALFSCSNLKRKLKIKLPVGVLEGQTLVWVEGSIA